MTRQSAASLGTAVPVDVFSPDEALAFLTTLTGLNDDAGAAAVAAELGYLPLPLAHAAAVIGAATPSVRRVPGSAADAAGQEVPEPGGQGRRTRRSMAEAVLLSLECGPGD